MGKFRRHDDDDDKDDDDKDDVDEYCQDDVLKVCTWEDSSPIEQPSPPSYQVGP